MSRAFFFILLAIGVIGFLIMQHLEVRYSAGYTFIYFALVFEIRRWWLRRQHKLSRWHFWNPMNLFDQFKRP